MSETLGEMIVRLGLDSKKFDDGIKNINKQMRVAKSEFAAYGKSAETTGTSIDFLQTKQQSLQKVIELQKKAVQTHSDAIKTNRARISELAEKQGELKTRVDQAKTAYQQSKKALGEEAEETKKLKAEYEKLKGEYQANEGMIQKAVNAERTHTTQLNKSKGALADYEVELQKTTHLLLEQESGFLKAGAKIEFYGQNLEKIGGKASKLGKTLTLGLTTPIAAIGTAAIKSSMDFETAYMGVQKTVDMTATETESMRKSIIKLSEELPHTKTEISGVAEAAGQLGIQKENILGFTETMLSMGVATNLSANDAATSFARFANIMQSSQKDFDRMGSSVVELGNNTATTEAEIVDMAMGLAAAGKQANMSESEVFGIAAALSSLGIEAERGGTAFSKLVIGINDATANGGEKLEQFAKVAGVSASEFAEVYRKDALEAVMMFTEGLGKIGESGGDVMSVLGEMDIKEVRLRDTILRLAGSNDVLRSSVELSNKAWEENTALTEEADKFNSTAASKMQVFKNRVNSLAVELGDDLVPVLISVLDSAEPLIDAWKDLDDETKKQIITWAGVTAAAGPVVGILGKVAQGTGKIVEGAGKAVTGLGKLIVQNKEIAQTGNIAGQSTSGLGAILSRIPLPAKLAVGGVAALAAILISAATATQRYQKELDKAADTTEELGWYSEDTGALMYEAAQRIGQAELEITEQFADMGDGIVTELYALKAQALPITDEIKQELVSKVDEMGSGMVSAINTRTSEAVTAYSNLFARTTGITDEASQEIINIITTKGAEQAGEVTKIQGEINAIIEKAWKENRELTAEESQEIVRLTAEMNNKIQEIANGNQAQQMKLEQDIKDGRIQLSQEGYDKVAQIAEEAYDKESQAAFDAYAQTISYADTYLKADKEKYDQAVAMAEQALDTNLNNAKINRGETLDLLYQQNKKEIDALKSKYDEYQKLRAENDEMEILKNKEKFGELMTEGDYYRLAELEAQTEWRNKTMHDLELGEEELAQLEYYKPLWENSELVRELTEEEMDRMVDFVHEKLVKGGKLTAEDAQIIADNIENPMAVLPDILKGYGEADALAIAQGLEDGGIIPKGAAKSLVDSVFRPFSTLPNEMKSSAEKAVNGYAESLKAKGQKLPGTAEELIGYLNGPFADVPEEWRGHAVAAMQKLVEGMEPGPAREQAQTVVDCMLLEFDGLKTETGIISAEAVDSIVENLTKGGELTEEEALALVEATADPLHELPSLFEGRSKEATEALLKQLVKAGVLSEDTAEEIGKLINEGMTDGIQKSQKAPVAAAQKATELVMQAMEKVAEVRSASRRARRVGENIMLGLPQGMTSKQAAAITTAKSIAEKVMQGLNMGGRPKVIGADGIIQYNSGIQGQEPSAKETAQRLMQATVSALNMGDSPRVEGETGGRKYGQGLEGEKPEVIQTAASMANAAIAKIKEYRGGFEEAGAYLGQGNVIGLASKAAALVKEAKTMAKNALEAMKKELKINSPSKEGEEIFEYLGEGAVLGLRNKKRDIYREGSQYANAALQGMSQYNAPLYDASIMDYASPAKPSRQTAKATQGFDGGAIYANITIHANGLTLAEAKILAEQTVRNTLAKEARRYNMVMG